MAFLATDLPIIGVGRTLLARICKHAESKGQRQGPKRVKLLNRNVHITGPE